MKEISNQEASVPVNEAQFNSIRGPLTERKVILRTTGRLGCVLPSERLVNSLEDGGGPGLLQECSCRTHVTIHGSLQALVTWKLFVFV